MNLLLLINGSLWKGNQLSQGIVRENSAFRKCLVKLPDAHHVKVNIFIIIINHEIQAMLKLNHFVPDYLENPCCVDDLP